jgi:hypothetical protein
MNLIQALCGTGEPVVPMLKENLKWRTHKRESTDAEHRGGEQPTRLESSG